MAITTDMSQEQPLGLSVKGIKGTIEDQHMARLRLTPKDTPLPELKQRLNEDGYLFVKNFIPREDVLHIRRRYVRDAQTHSLCEIR